MKKIFYRISNSEYQSGLFISAQAFVSILSIICFIIAYVIYTLDFSIWFQLPLFLIFGGIASVYSETYKFKFIDLKYDAELYIHKLSKSKSKYYDVKHKIIGEYEYNSVVRNTTELITFYKDCLNQIKNINTNEQNINSDLLSLLQENFEEKLYQLKKVNRFDNFEPIGNDASQEEYLLRKKSILKKSQKLINEIENLIIVSNRTNKNPRIESLYRTKEKSEEIYDFMKSNL